ncbi:MAG: hypothetical protein HYR55_04325 [Acidobacteria bacterium]|nr:hypothetical protein [Acidobacteriota bacterium]MBI3656330.1 hypothetical protein [Acidobacteriota bacterium]
MMDNQAPRRSQPRHVGRTYGLRRVLIGLILGVGLGFRLAPAAPTGAGALFRFDRDTVIVWRAEMQEAGYDFVVRIAQFEPKRLFEWESSANQGVVLLDPSAIQSSRSFQTSKLFSAGSETKSKDETAIWLSKEAFRELADAGHVQVKLDSIANTWRIIRRETVPLQVNREEVQIPVIVVADSRGGEWAFYDHPDNPFFVRHTIRGFTQAIKSITTNRKNTLRWLKESKIRSLTS